MALRHSGERQYMCRKMPGITEARVCDQHEGRCVVCDCFTDMSTVVRICDECGFSKGGDQRCIVCGKDRASEPAFFCRHCVMLEKDRDGCPKIMNLSSHQQMAHVRSNNATGTGSAAPQV